MFLHFLCYFLSIFKHNNLLIYYLQLQILSYNVLLLFILDFQIWTPILSNKKNNSIRLNCNKIMELYLDFLNKTNKTQNFLLDSDYLLKGFPFIKWDDFLFFKWNYTLLLPFHLFSEIHFKVLNLFSKNF